MQCAHNCKQQHCPCQEVPSKEYEECEVAHHKHCLARVAIYHEAAKWPYYQCCDCVAGKHYAYHLLTGLERVVQVKRQQRHYQVERKKQHEIACANFYEVSVPQPFFYFFHGTTFLGVGVYLLVALFKFSNQCGRRAIYHSCDYKVADMDFR